MYSKGDSMEALFSPLRAQCERWQVLQRAPQAPSQKERAPAWPPAPPAPACMAPLACAVPWLLQTRACPEIHPPLSTQLSLSDIVLHGAGIAITTTLLQHKLRFKLL